jgi:hypothetical protein
MFGLCKYSFCKIVFIYYLFLLSYLCDFCQTLDVDPKVLKFRCDLLLAPGFCPIQVQVFNQLKLPG